ncbi:MAG: type II toxin-antitoxin system RelB/DinJ family antitoxin [Pseudomonadaceae bacterium]|nr:type II toxin-antitoxin system RelB/DinJ family antitoxin [Pseudomonadaceae bacterium]
MASTEVVRTRIESELKASATEILEGMGVTVSQAIRMLLVQIVQDKELPFKVKAPNAKTRAVMDATDRGEGLRTHESTAALFKDLDI